MNRFGWLAVLFIVVSLAGCAAVPGNSATSSASPYAHDDGSRHQGGGESSGGGGGMGM